MVVIFLFNCTLECRLQSPLDRADDNYIYYLLQIKPKLYFTQPSMYNFILYEKKTEKKKPTNNLSKHICMADDKIQSKK